jgi:hypothetical protein
VVKPVLWGRLGWLGDGAGVNYRKMYVWSVVSVLEVKGSLLSILSRTSRKTSRSATGSIVKSVRTCRNSSCEYKNRKLCDVPELASPCYKSLMDLFVLDEWYSSVFNVFVMFR